MKKEDLKTTLLYLQSIDKKLGISQLSSFFSDVSFSPFLNAESLTSNIKYNQNCIVIINLEDFNNYSSKLFEDRRGKTTVIIYDPENKAFENEID
ncbi:MAG: hypothetical protein ACK4IX_10230 [Candidatus Sericytochromatia bacterium]